MGSLTPQINVSGNGLTAAQNAAKNASAKALQLQVTNGFPQQSYVSKTTGQVQRFTLSVTPIGSTPITFKAHLDPSDLNRKQTKRYASLDVLTGVVLQDFGYKPEILEVKGTTGSAYYTEITTMDNIFNNQNLGGNPSPVSIVLEQTSYTALWTDFSFNRIINASAGNLIQYAMSFTILSRQSVSQSSKDTVAAGSSVVASNSNSIANSYSSSVTPSNTVTWSGSMYTYAVSNKLTPNYEVVRDYMRANWNSNGANPGIPVPSDTAILPSGSVLTVPINWSSVAGFINT